MVFSCWFIWRAYCDAIFNELNHYSFITLLAITTALVSFQEASTPRSLLAFDSTSHSKGMHRPSLWSPPPINWIKLNVNACWK
ncbi:hypothetical protein COP1_040734 [Malus domestica]